MKRYSLGARPICSLLAAALLFVMGYVMTQQAKLVHVAVYGDGSSNGVP